MAKEEFNLSEKRKEVIKLIKELIIYKPDNKKLIELIKNQDKEFIKRLKEGFCCCGRIHSNKCLNCRTIDKLAGNKLT